MTEPDAVLAELATGLWRLTRRMVDQRTGEPAAEFRPLTRHVRALWDVLEAAGVETQSHDGTPFDPGVALKVVAFTPSETATREYVVETVRPTVYRAGNVIQHGEVIVGTPIGPPPEEATS